MAKTAQTPQAIKDETKNEIVGISLVALAVLLLIFFYLVPMNSSPDTSKAGSIGVFTVRLLAGITGMGRFILPVLMVVLGFWVLRRKSRGFVKQKLLGVIMLFLCSLIFLHFSVPETSLKSYLITGLKGQGGGLVGAFLCWLIQKGFGKIGAQLVLAAFSLVSMILVTEISLAESVKKICAKLKAAGKFLKTFVFNFIYEDVDQEEPVPQNTGWRKGMKNPEKDFPVIITQDYGMGGQENWTNTPPEEPLPQPLEIISSKQKIGKPAEPSHGLALSEEKSKPQDGLYQLPSTELLENAAKIKNPRINKDITDRIRILEDTLDSFGVKVKVTQVSCGPAVTRYEMQPCPGVKVSRIVNLADDIALNLAAPGVRIEAPVPGKSVIGIEVPKKEISTVCFREVLETPQFAQSLSKLTVALGKDITGNPVVADLASMPHLLIAGATGSGKSVCMNTLICSILFKAKPAEVKFLMIDPKMVELANYNGLPHLVAPVITDPKRAAGALKWIVNEMENRYNLFASTGVKDLFRFNEVKLNTGEELPQMVVLIDELADLMMVAPGDVEDSICRLAQMARAAGIHLVVATQRPSVDVITGLIKANVPSRIAFAVSSQTDSRTILDMGGAEKLLGKGDMLFNPVGASKPLRVQGVYVPEEDINAIVSHCSGQGKPQYLNGIMQNDYQVEEKRSDHDELFMEAAKLVISSGQASVSMLQRRFRIGYSRAARLMDILENHGIVGGYEGSKPRTVLITMEQLERMHKNELL